MSWYVAVAVTPLTYLVFAFFQVSNQECNLFIIKIASVDSQLITYVDNTASQLHLCFIVYIAAFRFECENWQLFATKEAVRIRYDIPVSPQQRSRDILSLNQKYSFLEKQAVTYLSVSKAHT